MAKSTVNGFTKTELGMLAILSDGKAHRREELHKCMGPSSLSSVAIHIWRTRQKLPEGEDIVCVIRERSLHYQHVRLLASAYDGRK